MQQNNHHSQCILLALCVCAFGRGLPEKVLGLAQRKGGLGSPPPPFRGGWGPPPPLQPPELSNTPLGHTLASASPRGRRVLAHGKSQNALKMGYFGTKNGSKNGSKTCFSKSDPGPFGMLKQVFVARFEPVLTKFSPFHHMYAPLCALRTYLRAVWWSHLDLGEGCRLEDIYIYPSQWSGG